MIWNISSRELKKVCNNGVCNHCGKRLVTFGADVHKHEYHSGAIGNDADDVVLERMKEEALL